MTNPFWIAHAPPGLEDLVAAEIRALGGGIGKTRKEPALVRFEGPPDAGYRANLRLRCAERILKPLRACPLDSFAAMRIEVSKLPWEDYLPTRCRISFSVSAKGCKLYHTGAVADALREGLELRGLRFSEDPAAPGLSIDARGTRDWWTLSVDTSGRSLTRRGYRKQTAKAPLRETLAASVLRLAGYTGEQPLVDPMCGSGTFVIEAGLVAMNRAAGQDRSFAFEAFPSFDSVRWEEVKATASSAVLDGSPPSLEGGDRTGGAVRAARANARRAGLQEVCRFAERKLADLPRDTGPGLVVLNPPYGHRTTIPDSEAREAWASWGRILRERRPGWEIALVSPDAELAKAFGASGRPRARFKNGGIPVALWILPSP
ncbi:MAG: RNA methyltransferase [Myxococcota bacterium]|nr:RNA methyltransferase [Myxococcota bacterium]